MECLAHFRKKLDQCPLDGAELTRLEGEPLVGMVVANRYVIEKCIGEGGMGRVYQARHQRVSRRFAIKILYGELAAEPKMRKRFSFEAEAASRLSHRNVISVLDFGETVTGLPYLVMDLVDGESLADLLKRDAPFERDRILHLAYQLADGLQHAHENSLVHRDFKPDNAIVATERGEEVPKIVDFGIAHIRDDNFDHDLTTAGYVMGTAAYMAPEQALGDRVDGRSDLYSLGVVLYQMTAGVHPFEGTGPELLRQTLTIPAPPVRVRVPGFEPDPALEAVVLRLLAKRPEERYPSAEALMQQLSQMPTIAKRPGRRMAFSTGAGSAYGGAGPSQPNLPGANITTDRTIHDAKIARFGRSRRIRIALIALLVLALAAVLGLVYRDLDSGSSSAGAAGDADANALAGSVAAPVAAPNTKPDAAPDERPDASQPDGSSHETLDAGPAIDATVLARRDSAPDGKSNPTISQRELRRRLEIATRLVSRLESEQADNPKAKKLADRLFELSTQLSRSFDNSRARARLHRKLKAVEYAARRELRR